MCDVKGCRKQSDLVYYRFNICDSCWEKHCNDKIDLKKEFKIKIELDKIAKLVDKDETKN